MVQRLSASMHRFLLLFQVFKLVLSSPFDLTDNYVKEFKTELETFKKSSEEYVYTKLNYTDSLYNETQALEEALSYDFIIIGAGTSGSVIANRLTEVPEWDVLLLEAGSPENRITEIPRMHRHLQQSRYNWGYSTTPQKHWCQGMIENRCRIPSGKILGGNTGINEMTYTRGNKRDYDLWSDQGNDGWCYDDVLPYFKKAEDADLKDFDYHYHRRGGPFHVEQSHGSHIAEQILTAGKELGYETVDFNGKDQLGFGLVQTNSKHGKRQSTARAYLEPGEKRKNLHVQTDSQVTKIIVDPETKIVTGVTYLQGGKLHGAKARKEVVLTAGAISSPHLLLLSGIGPKEQLERVGIPVIKDAKVGHNLKQHSTFALDFVYNQTQKHQHQDYDQVVDYLKNDKGPLTSPNGVEVLAFLQTEVSTETVKYPDVQIAFSEQTLTADPKVNPQGLKDEINEALLKDHEGKKAIRMQIMLTHPKSVGTLTLEDTDPLHHPLIDPNLFSDPEGVDSKTLLAGIRMAVKLSETPQLQKSGLVLNQNPVPGCEGHVGGNDDFWQCSIKYLTQSLGEITGTVRMGPVTDGEAVVNNKLKVYGVGKLRVADSSVIPVTITGHNMAAEVMLGEKASDLIKDEFNQHHP